MKTKIDKSKSRNKSSSPFFNSKNDPGFFNIQQKLKVGQPGDKYEVEADRVADEVVNSQSENQPFFAPAQSNSIQTKPNRFIQEKPIAENITPLVQRQEEEEEEAQAKLQEITVQRQEEEEEELQMQPIEEEEEMLQPKLRDVIIQRQVEEEEETLQMQEEEELQMQSEEEEEMLQPKADAPLKTEQLLNSSKGNGSSLDSETQSQMEGSFGADFGGVKIHTDSTAVQMNRELGAQAFTTSNNIYFNEGKYNPQTQNGRKLLAHELTHTIQQKNTAKQTNPGNSISKTNYNIQGGFFGNLWRGIKRGVRSVGRGIRRVGSAVWSGIRTVAGYGWNVLRSAGSWVWNLVTETPTRIWRILQHIGSAVIGNISRVFNGIRNILGRVWQTAKKVFTWLKGGIPGMFSWIWSGLRSGAGWAYRVLSGDLSALVEGMRNMFSRLGNGVVNLIRWGWDGLKVALVWAWRGAKATAVWLGRALLSGAAWAGRLIAKLLDLVGFGEIMDLLFNIIKINTRTLNPVERQQAKRVFGSSINYGQVRIDEASLIAIIGAFFSGSSGMGVTLFHTINFNKKINAAPGNGDMRWLVHELAHVCQYEYVGSQYIGEAIHAQATVGYNYGDGAGLVGKDLREFNREQQADILAHYYYYILSGNNDARFTGYATEYTRMVTQARAGRF